MNETLLVAGCSITHGLATYTDNYHLKNTEYSFAKYFADYLNINYLNVAYPGVSNEFIFHRVLSNINNNVKKILVCWTSNGRESWENAREIWEFHSCYACYTQKNVDTIAVDATEENNKIVSSNEFNLGDIKKMQKSFIRKISTDDYETKLTHYSLALRTICKDLNIEYIETKVLENNLNCFNIAHRSKLIKNGLHPDIVEHKEIFQELIRYYEQTKR